MSLTLDCHLLASFCHELQRALREHDAPFHRHIVDLSDPTQAAERWALWPVGEFPALRDPRRDRVVPESTIIVENLDPRYGEGCPLIPANDDARAVRLRAEHRDVRNAMIVRALARGRVQDKPLRGGPKPGVRGVAESVDRAAAGDPTPRLASIPDSAGRIGMDLQDRTPGGHHRALRPTRGRIPRSFSSA